MSRNVQFQVLRGTQAQLSTLTAGNDPDTDAAVNPLQLGELYFATDTGNLFLGNPGVGLGYILLGDQTAVNERLDQLIVLMECTRRALVALACQDSNGNKELDFDPATISEELAASAPIGR